MYSPQVPFQVQADGHGSQWSIGPTQWVSSLQGKLHAMSWSRVPPLARLDTDPCLEWLTDINHHPEDTVGSDSIISEGLTPIHGIRNLYRSKTW